MSEGVLRSFLVSRLQRFSTAREFGITRRQLLVGTTAAGLATVPSPIRARPRVHREGNAVVVLYGGHEWRLDPADFAPGAGAACRPSPADVWLKLTRATLAGTDLNISVVARIYEQDEAWRIRLRAPGIRAAGDFPLLAWMSGDARLEALFDGRLELGPSCSAMAREATVSLGASTGLQIAAGRQDLSVRAPGRALLRARSLLLRSSKPGEGDLRSVAGIGDLPGTKFSFSGLRTERTPRIRCGNSPAHAKYHCSDLHQLAGEVGQTVTGTRAGFVLIDGPARLTVISGRSAGSLRLGKASAISAAVGRKRQLHVAGEICDEMYADCGVAVAKLAAEPDEPLFAEFQSGRPAQLFARARLTSLQLPLSGDTHAFIEVASAPVELVSRAGSRSADARAASNRTGSVPNRIVLGPSPFLIVRLDSTRLRIKRGTDLFDLTFELTNYTLEVDSLGEAYLQRKRPPFLKREWPAASLTVHFPPQHIGETITDVQGLDCTKQIRPTPVSARQYGPSRLSFDLGKGRFKDLHWVDRPLTIESLTEWTNLPLIVQDRARDSLGVDTDAQLAVVQINQHTTLEQAFQNIASTIVPPSANQTSLELSGHLIFSPSEAGRWLTPRAEPGSWTPIWNTRLNDTGRQTVRAIWSNWMTPGQFGHAFMTTDPDPNQAPIPWDQALLALDPDDHWEIVGQTSVYGLPALRRIADPNDPKPNADDFRNVPRATVVRPAVDPTDPKPSYDYLNRIDQCQYNRDPESGVAVAAPFNDADITLTSQGGVFTADWHGDPPLLLPIEGHTWCTSLLGRFRNGGTPRPQRLKGFELERLSIETWLGRDIRVETFIKGYLLPLGIRASFVEFAERRYLKHPDRSYPVAYEVKRTLIIIQRPDKQFPAVNQPYSANVMPAKHVTMLTHVTPDLLSPKDGDATANRLGGRVLEGQLESHAIVFWPRVGPAFEAGGITPAKRGDVKFKFACDGDVTPAIGNMLFVSNDALGSENDLALIADHYRNSPLNQRTFTHSGATRAYAPTEREGETKFDTDNWVMTVSGRKLPQQGGGEIESFLMDGRMEGADQPPFYPELYTADIVIQSLDRLLGRSQGVIRVRYPDLYRLSGFSAANPGEIFLEVLEPSIPIGFGGQSDAVGAVAQPDAFLAALSRKTGLVGGSKAGEAPQPVSNLLLGKKATTGFRYGVFQSPAPHRALAAVRALGPPEPPAASYDQAKKGDFSPEEFFGDNATLLGVIKLRDVIKAAVGELGAAPQLLETLTFGAAADAAQDQVLGKIRAAAQALLPVIATTLSDVDAAIVQIRIDPPPGTGLQPVTFDDLYPDLARDYKGARSALAGPDSLLLAISNAQSLEDVALAATKLVTALRPLPGSIERVARDPIPPLVQGALDTLSGTWKQTKSLVEGGPAQLLQILAARLDTTFLKFCSLIKADLGSVLLGLDDGVSCDDLLANPGDAAPRLAATLFADQFAEPLTRAISMVRDLESAASGRIEFARNLLRSHVRDILDQAEATIDTALQHVKESIANPDERQALSEGLIDDVRIHIQNAGSQGGEPLDVLKRTTAAIGDVPQIVGAHVTAWRNNIIVIAGQDADSIYQGFRQAVLDPIAKEISDRLTSEVDRVQALVETQLVLEAGAVADQLVNFADQIVDALVSCSAFGAIAETGSALAGWCSNVATANVVQAANALANEMAGDQTEIEDAITGLTNILTGSPFPTPFPAVEQVRRRALQLIQATGDLVLEIGKVREDLGKLANAPKAGFCSAPGQFLQPASRLFQLRIECCDRTAEITDQAIALTREMTSATMAASVISGVETAFARNARVLCSHLTSIDVVWKGKAGWANALAQVAALQNEINASEPQYTSQLGERLQELQAKAASLGPLIDAAQDPATLAGLKQDVLDYARAYDKVLASEVLQSVAMPSGPAKQLQADVDTFLKAVADAFQVIDQTVLNALNAILTSASQPPFDLLLNPDVVAKLRSAQAKLQNEVGKVTDVQNANPTRIKAAVALRDYWRTNKPPALVDVVTDVLQIVRALLNGNLGAVFNTNLRPALKRLEDQAQQALSQFVPTGLTASYDFSAALRAIPPLFKMSGPEQRSNLVINSTVEANFLTGQRTIEIKGEIEPFELTLVGSLDMATIYFDKATFSSATGSSPEFHVQVKDVELGELLEFLQPLQEWLSPSGSGFYIKPVDDDGPGIEAGYIYDAGVIQVGCIQFINVTFGVYAQLFFTGKDAQFGFFLSSTERPFLCACPPYGGGGNIKLIANATRITGMEVSFAMGAVAAIQFGPLNAQGRIVAGFSIRQYGDARELIAFVEAVGEGNIACFSICVALRVEMRRVEGSGNSQMYGWARYSFSFKVGRFFEISYSVTAHYGVEGGQKRSTSHGSRAGFIAGKKPCQIPPSLNVCRGPIPGGARLTNHVPPKASQWHDYSRHLSTDLL